MSREDMVKKAAKIMASKGGKKNSKAQQEARSKNLAKARQNRWKTG